MAAPREVDSITAGMCTGIPSVSATICGHSRPFAAPPVSTASPILEPIEILDDALVRYRNVSGTFLDGSETSKATGPFRPGDVEAEEPWRGMHPVPHLHYIGEQAEYAVRPRRQVLGFALHERVRVYTVRPGLRYFELTKRIAKPPHDQSTEADPFHHPQPRGDVARGA